MQIPVDMSPEAEGRWLSSGEYNYNDAVKRWWTKSYGKLDIAEAGRIFVPVNLNGNHWILIVIDVDAGLIEQYDSLNKDNKVLQSKVLENLRRWVEDQSNGTINIATWKLISVESPQQKNLVDCGVFTILALKRLVENQPLKFKQKDIPKKRKEIAASIRQNQLSF